MLICVFIPRLRFNTHQAECLRARRPKNTTRLECSEQRGQWYVSTILTSVLIVVRREAPVTWYPHVLAAELFEGLVADRELSVVCKRNGCSISPCSVTVDEWRVLS